MHVKRRQPHVAYTANTVIITTPTTTTILSEHSMKTTCRVSQNIKLPYAYFI